MSENLQQELALPNSCSDILLLCQIMGPGVDKKCTGFGMALKTKTFFPMTIGVPCLGQSMVLSGKFQLTRKAMINFWSESTSSYRRFDDKVEGMRETVLRICLYLAED